MAENTLYYGDNLDILRKYIPDESVDLVYLDPPFNSNATYNVLFKEPTGELSTAQVRAFSDTWHWDLTAEATFNAIVTEGPPQVARMVSALREFIGRNDMMAYIVMMSPRLVELRRVLKPTGSLYLHCDPTASHYLKIVMDTIFSPRMFVNEIVWKRSAAHSDRAQGSTHFGRLHDVLLFYSKAGEHQWNQLYQPQSEKHLAIHYGNMEPGTGRRYTLDNITGPGGAAKGNPAYEVMGVTRYWRFSRERMQQLIDAGLIVQPRPGAVPRQKRYLDEMAGRPLQDVWDDIPPINSQAKERLGYPTQKPEALLERIISSCSDEGDLVLDPFCGCGTAVVVAQKLKRRWIGIDLTHLAITVMKKRLTDSFDLTPGIEYAVLGEPTDIAGAQALAEQDRYQFQWWALSLVGASPAADERKKGADRGIDGVMTFVEAGGKAKLVLVSVKSGHVNASQVRDLRGAMEREKADLGLFVTLGQATAPMRSEAAAAGFYHSDLWQADFPRIQICEVSDLLAGRLPPLPRHAAGAFAQAQHVGGEKAVQGQLLR